TTAPSMPRPSWRGGGRGGEGMGAVGKTRRSTPHQSGGDGSALCDNWRQTGEVRHPWKRSRRFDRRAKAFARELFDVKLGSVPPSCQEDGTASVVCLPHLVRRLGAREARQLHHATDDEHQIECWVTVKDQSVAG